MEINWKRITKNAKKVNFTSIMFLVLSLISTTFAWFAFSNIVDNDMNIDIKAWKVNISDEDSLITNKIDINLDNFYPGVEMNNKTITITNEGDLASVVSYKINYLRIFDEVFDVSNQEELFDKLAQQYPFVVAFSLDKKYLDVGEKSEFSYSVAWPLDSGDDILDAKWGNDAYDFLFNETQKYNADNTYEVRDCIKIEVELIVEQFVDDGFNGYDVNYSFGKSKYLNSSTLDNCLLGDANCYKYYVIEEDNLSNDATVLMMASAVETYPKSVYSQTGNNIIDINTLLNIVSKDVINTKIVKPGLSDRVLGVSNNEDYYNNLLSDLRNSGGYIEFSSMEFDFLNSGECYWVKSGPNPNLAVKTKDFDSVILYYETSNMCKSVPDVDYVK